MHTDAKRKFVSRADGGRRASKEECIPYSIVFFRKYKRRRVWTGLKNSQNFQE